MPAYNAEKYMEASIASVIDQTYTNWELIIVNDGSVDNTLPIAERYTGIDKRIRVVTQVNKRLAAARNTGIRNSEGEWITFLDSDDIWHKEKLEKQILISRQQPDISFIYTGGWIFNESNLDDLKPYPTIYGKYTSVQMYNAIYKCNYIPVLSVMVRADIIKKVQFSEDKLFFYGCEDWDCWFRVAATDVNFYGLDEPLFYYRRHSNNMSNKGLEMYVAQTTCMLKNFNDTLDDKASIKKYLKDIVDPLVSKLIVAGKANEAVQLLDGIARIKHRISYKFRALLVKTLGKLSLYPVRAVAKLDSLIKA